MLAGCQCLILNTTPARTTISEISEIELNAFFINAGFIWLSQVTKFKVTDMLQDQILWHLL